MLDFLRLGRRIDLRGRGVRGLAVLIALGVIVVALWQSGALLRDPNEAVETRDGSGNLVIVNIRAADASIETPDVAGLAVALRQGALAPNFEVSALTGERVTLADFRGKAVFLNFWATWCGPCRAEMPEIEGVLRRYEDAGLVVLAINNGEPFGPASNFIKELGLRLTTVGLDPSQQVINRYRVTAMPTSIFIDPSGVITRIHAGIASAKQMDQFAQEALGISTSGQ